jgi:hypothetical protein
VYLLIDGREWRLYPFLPVIVNLIFLVLAWPLGAALDRQTRTYLRDQDLDVARINDVANLATDLSLKLSFYAGVVPILSIFAITVIASEPTKASSAALFAVMGFFGFVVLPYMLFAQPGRLSEQFARGRLPRYEQWLLNAGIRSYGILLSVIYIVGVTMIEIAVAYLQLPKD